MNKIKNLLQVAKISAKARKAGKKVGLITGCFDVIHAGHVDLFRFAKKHCDLVIVGLDSDETIKINKGLNRPIHNISQRERVLEELESVDLIFEIEGNENWSKVGKERKYYSFTKKIEPNYLITNPDADQFWEEKRERAKYIGARLLTRKTDPLSSTRIIKFFTGEM